MIRRVLALLCAAIVATGSAGAPPVAATGPWAISSSSDRVSAAFTSATTGSDVALALTNRTSIADELYLGPAAALVLDALGLDGTYSQSATWTAGPGPRLECPPVGVSDACVLTGNQGTVVIPGSVRAMLLAHAQTSPGGTNLAVAPDLRSLVFDVTLVAIGIALNAGCAGGLAGASADEITDLVIQLYPEAAGAGAALGRGDLRTASTELIALAERAWSVITKHAVGSAIGLGLCAIATLVPGMLEVRIGIGVAKAAVPLTNLVAVILRGAAPPVTVTIAYNGGIAAVPTATPTAAAQATPPPSALELRRFESTGSMLSAQLDATATLLPDGKVLVAGGCGAQGGRPVGLDTAELYDPSSGTFTIIGRMVTPHCGAGAVLLPNGKVLIAGGDSYNAGSSTIKNTPIDSAEVFDEQTGTFQATGPLIEPRDQAQFELLADGNVLVVGGVSTGYRSTSSAELYDYRNGGFRPTGSMSTARSGAAVVKLQNGDVLVAGGSTFTNVVIWTNTAEVYLSGRDTFSTVGPLPVSADGISATLLASGDALLAGGRLPPTGGSGDSAAINAVETYDPQSSSFTATGHLAVARVGPLLVTLPDGSVLIVGGFDGTANPIVSAERYDPVAARFESIPSPLFSARVDSATQLANGSVLLIHADGRAEIYR